MLQNKPKKVINIFILCSASLITITYLLYIKDEVDKIINFMNVIKGTIAEYNNKIKPKNIIL